MTDFTSVGAIGGGARGTALAPSCAPGGRAGANQRAAGGADPGG